MIRGLLYGLKKFWSEVFSGDLLILFLSIVLAVTSISSVGFLGDRLKSSMQMQASSILGADLVLRSASKIDSKYLDLAAANNLDWFYHLTGGHTHTDFFAIRPTDYSKANEGEDFEDIW